MVRVCVIGAGIAGLGATKACIEEGLTPVCYEIYREVGGLWNCEESIKRTDDGPTIYPTLRTNLSKEMTCYSDFPMPMDYPVFLSWQHVFKYLQSYANAFDLRQYIKFRHQVTDVKPVEKDSTVKWQVTTFLLDTNETKVDEFDKVMICTGKFCKKFIPDVEGLDSFPGDIVHACNYNPDADYRDKNVLVVGPGNSGCDIAVDISEKAKNVYLSMRHGVYLVNRFMSGVSFDMEVFSRFKAMARNTLPVFLVNFIVNRIFSRTLNHQTYGLQSEFSAMNPRSTLTVNDDMGKCIAFQTIKAVKGIKEVKGRTVYLTDGNILKDVDMILFSTGYKMTFPFISDEIVPDDPSKMFLHKWIFPIAFSDPTSLAVISSYPNVGEARTVAAELQARYAAQVMSGSTKLPSVKKMKKEHEKEFEYYTKWGTDFVFRAQPNTYSDSLASSIGAYPSFFSIFFRDPRLAFSVFFGPSVPYHYRILGRHKWPEARKYTLNVKKNCMSGLNCLTEEDNIESSK